MAADMQEPKSGKATTAKKPADGKNPAPAKSAMPKSAGKNKTAETPDATSSTPGESGQKDAAKKADPKSADKNKSTGSSASVAFYNHKAKSGVDSDTENDLKKVMVDTLKDIYYAEKRILKALPKMAKAAAHDSLREAFTTHRDETETQIQKVEQAFELLGLKAQSIKCVAMDGLLEEADEHMSEYVKGAGRDAAMIIGAQKVEHYEMAAYGSLRTFAQNLGLKEVAQIFQDILNQESATDKKLTQLAKTINTDALKAHKEGKA